MQLELELKAFYSGDRVVSPSKRRGVVKDPGEYRVQNLPGHVFVHFDGEFIPAWIPAKCLHRVSGRRG